jgi:hypothetical protein
MLKISGVVIIVCLSALLLIVGIRNDRRSGGSRKAGMERCTSTNGSPVGPCTFALGQGFDMVSSRP